MATVNIGNLTFTHKGDYASGTAYVKNDVVYYSTNGNAYIAKQATTGNAPTNGTYWSQFAAGSGGIWNAGLSLGSANQSLRVNSGASALEFYTPSGGGVLQFKQAVKKGTQTIQSTSGVAITDTEISLTPASASNKILVRGFVNYGGNTNLYESLKLFRKIGSGSYAVVSDAQGDADSSATRSIAPMQGVSTGNPDWKVFHTAFEFLDTPNTTSQVYYQLYTGYANDSLRINEEEQSDVGNYDTRPITTLSISELSSTIL